MRSMDDESFACLKCGSQKVVDQLHSSDPFGQAYSCLKCGHEWDEEEPAPQLGGDLDWRNESIDE